MSDVELVNPIPVEEHVAWFSAMMGTFLDGPDPEAHANSYERWRRGWLPERRWGARADGRWIATLATFATTLTAPGGGAVPADALMMVTVAATHKRRGILTRMLTDSLRSARDRGEVVSALHAAEWPIYGRFGYAPAEASVEYRLDPRLPGAAVPQTDAGRVRQVDATQLRAVAPAVFEIARRLRAGGIDRDERRWDGDLGVNGLTREGPLPTYVVHDGADRPDGYLAWVGNDAESAVRVDLQAATDTAYRGLWEYLTRIDLVKRIDLARRPTDEPVRWLLPDGRALTVANWWDGIWLRLLDVPAALAGRTYSTEDRVVLEVVDEVAGGFAAGRYRLDGGPAGATCVRTRTDSPDLRLDQRSLAAGWTGGFTLRQQAVAGLVDEFTPGALDRIDAMLRTSLAPWCATSF